MAIVAPGHTVEEIEYCRHGERAMILRLYRPTGPGPFPIIVDLHGGAWCKGSIDDCGPRDERLAGAGFAAAALDFRHAGDGYPSSLVDINYATRWLKAHARELGLDAEHVGYVGQSSGGHLAMLAAMRPRDPRYTMTPLDGVDATVNCVAMVWPVINPLSRYRHALRERAKADPASWVGDIPERHDLYWHTEANMRDGNPILALEDGEAVETPPTLWIQGEPDPVHDYRDLDSDTGLNEPDRFAHGFRHAGGEIELFRFEKATQTADTVLDALLPFFGKHL
ncbi:MAG: acetyl esterase [Myxococcota bacterium]|jgi:acetyl esterase